MLDAVTFWYYYLKLRESFEYQERRIIENKLLKSYNGSPLSNILFSLIVYFFFNYFEITSGSWIIYLILFIHAIIQLIFGYIITAPIRKRKTDEIFDKILEKIAKLFLEIWLYEPEEKIGLTSDGFEDFEYTNTVNNSSKKYTKSVHPQSVTSALKCFNLPEDTTDFLKVKKRYRELMKRYHPDTATGDKEIAKMIIRDYKTLKEYFRDIA